VAVFYQKILRCVKNDNGVARAKITAEAMLLPSKK
jgi:hypothetical protein